jgi:hypothetical protein
METGMKKRGRALSREEAQAMARQGWARYPTLESRRIKTLKMRVATGQAAQAELDRLREAGTPGVAVHDGGPEAEIVSTQRVGES